MRWPTPASAVADAHELRADLACGRAQAIVSRVIPVPLTISSRARLVLHQKSAADESVRIAVDAARAAGHHLEVRVTWEPGDAAHLAREAVALGFQRVIAGGGDGTVSEIARVLAETPSAEPVALSVLPLGTANDFARAAAIPESMTDALSLALVGDASPIDLVRVTAADGSTSVFVNVATGGFGTRLTADTPEALKKALGGAAYLLTGLTRPDAIASQHARMTGPDFVWEGHTLAIAVGNGRTAGGGVPMCPEALVDDGLLDLAVLPLPEGADLFILGAAFASQGTAAVAEGSQRTRAAWLEIASDEPIMLNLDGEPASSTAFRFEVWPAALLAVLPTGSPLRLPLPPR